jgi:hypothetical protein
MMTLLALCLLLVVSALFSVLPPNSTCLLIMSIFLRPSYKVNYYPGTATTKTSPGYDEDSRYIYRLLKPLYGMLSAAGAWHTTMSAFLDKEGYATVGFEKSMWRVVIDGHRILLGAHIDDFVIACANPPVPDAF